MASNIETDVALLKKDVDDLKNIHKRLDSAIEKIAEAFAINGGQAQKAAVTILVFLVQIAKAAGR